MMWRTVGTKICVALLPMIVASGCASNNRQSESTDVTISSSASQLAFPKGFQWGTASSAYQTEGAWDRDGRGVTNWDVLTQQYFLAQGQTGNIADDTYDLYDQDVKLMAAAGIKAYRFSISWARIYPTGFPFEINTATGQPVYDRNGNLIPVAPNMAGILYYDSLIDDLIANGIQPIATLYHWDMPIDLYESGGFNSRLTIQIFGAYAQTAFLAFGDRVTQWITLNEPNPYAIYVEGLLTILQKEAASGQTINQEVVNATIKNTPSEEYLGLQMTFLHNYLLSHATAVQIYHQLEASGAIAPGKIGIAVEVAVAKPASSSAADVAATTLWNEAANDMIILPIAQGVYPQECISRLQSLGYNFNISQQQLQDDLAFMKQQGTDFIGVNYYTRPTITAIKNQNTFPINGNLYSGPLFSTAYYYTTPQDLESSNGPYDPQGFYDGLMYIKSIFPSTPILVTENGASYGGDDDSLTDTKQVHDTMRIRFLDGHVKALWQAMHDGANVTGYTVWSPLDNFEWFSGYTKRFGMIYVDYENNLQRYPKDSYYWYKTVISNNAVSNP